MKDYQKGDTDTNHQYLDIRFENDRLVILVETKNSFNRWDHNKIRKQLQDYVRYEKAYSDKKIIAMLIGTPRTMRYGKVEKIIFPYKYVNNQIERYEEKEFEESYPCAFAYLNQCKEELMERKSDKKVKWFEYVRSQALSGIKCEKLLISTIITYKVCIYKLGEDCIPYAGMYISLRNQNQKYDLDFAKKF